MTQLEGSDVTVFATAEARQASRRVYIRLLKWTLLPFLVIMGFESGVLLAGSGLPRGLRILCSLVLGPVPSWLALRALNRRLRFWFALHPDALEVGPAKFGFREPYEQVALVQESYFEEVGDRYLVVLAGAKEAWVFLSEADVKACATAIMARCPWAVRVDDRGGEHLPEALAGDPASEPAQRAVRNLAVLRGRYAQASVRMAAIFLLCLAGLTVAGAGYLGLISLGSDARLAFLIPSTFFGALFGFFGWKQFGQWRDSDRVCSGTAVPRVRPQLGATTGPSAMPEGTNRATNVEPAFALLQPLTERLKPVFQSLVLVGTFGWLVLVGLLQFWLLPGETNQRRAWNAAMAVAPVALWAMWRSYFRRYHAILVYPHGIELRRGNVCDEIPRGDVLGLIGQGGINLDGGEIVAWKTIVIVRDDRRHVLGFHREDNARVYRALRAACPQAWGLPFPARLEPPLVVGQPEFASVAVAALGTVGQYYRRQIVRTATAGVVIAVGSLALASWIVGGVGVNSATGKALLSLVAGAVVGVMLIASARRELTTLRIIRRHLAGPSPAAGEPVRP